MTPELQRATLQAQWLLGHLDRQLQPAPAARVGRVAPCPVPGSSSGIRYSGEYVRVLAS